MLKQPSYKKVQTTLQKPVSGFKQPGPSKPQKDLNHIFRKYNQVSPVRAAPPNPKPLARPRNVHHQRNKPNSNVLDSINKNIHHRSGVDNVIKKPQIVYNGASKFLSKMPQTGLPVKRKASIKKDDSQKIIRTGPAKGARSPVLHSQFSGKFLVKNGNTNVQVDKRRNFSPMRSQKPLISQNELFPEQGKTTVNVTQKNLAGGQPLPQKTESRDSLGGGSRVNTKTGSVLGFGNNSRIPDNVSVISR